MEDSIAIGLTGLHRSGKDTVANYLSREYRFQKLTFSDVLKKRLKKRNREITKMNLSREGTALREKKGRDALAKELHSIIKDKEWRKVALSGFMSPEEVEYLEDKFDEFHLIKITAKPKKRFKRRHETESSDFEEFLERDEVDLDKGTEEVMGIADHRIRNNEGLEELHKKIDKIMKRIGVAKHGSE